MAYVQILKMDFEVLFKVKEPGVVIHASSSSYLGDGGRKIASLKPA